MKSMHGNGTQWSPDPVTKEVLCGNTEQSPQPAETKSVAELQARVRELEAELAELNNLILEANKTRCSADFNPLWRRIVMLAEPEPPKPPTADELCAAIEEIDKVWGGEFRRTRSEAIEAAMKLAARFRAAKEGADAK